MLLDWLPAIGVLVCGLAVLTARAFRGRRRSETLSKGDAVNLMLDESRSLIERGEAVDDLDRRFRNLIRATQLGWDATALAITMIGTALVAGFLVFLWSDEPFAFVSAAGLSLGLVWLGLALRAAYVRAKIVEQTPNFIEMFAGTLQAGVSVEKGLSKAAVRTQGVLGSELRRCSERTALGYAASDSLLELAERYRVVDLKLAATAMGVHRETGGNLSAVLSRLSTVARERLAYRKQIDGMTLSARAAALIVGSAGPLLLVYYIFWGNGLLKLWEDPSGQFFLMLAAGLELVGIVWVAAICRSSI